jgi:hypothetical protein
MTPITLRTRALTGALLSLLLATAPGFAADKPADKPKADATAKPPSKFLTKDQLRACMTQKAQAEQQDADLLKEQTALATDRAEVTRDGAALKEALVGLDRSNAEAVAAHNELALAQDKKIDAYQARVTAFNTRVEAGNAERVAYGKNCENKRFLEEDEIAIKKGK